MDTGQLHFPLTYKQDILDVKQGKYTVEELTSWIESLTEDARRSFSRGDLPTHPQTKNIEAIAIAEVKDFLYNLDGLLL